MLEEPPPEVSVIVPAYNEEENVSEVLQRLAKLDWLLPSMEMIVVDDGSTDQTAKEVAEFPFVKYIRHKWNRGKGAAIRTGIEKANGGIVVVHDADVEYSPTDIPRLVKPILKERADVVYGSRFEGKFVGMSFSHLVGNKILSMVTRILYGVHVTDVMTGHKAFRREVLDSFELKEEGFTIEAELTYKSLLNGWRFLEVPIVYSYRRKGVSKIQYMDGLKCLWKLLLGRFQFNSASSYNAFVQRRYVAEILKAAMHGAEKSQIMKKVNLSRRIFNSLFNQMVKRGYIRVIEISNPKGVIYATTLKGSSLLSRLSVA